MISRDARDSSRRSAFKAACVWQGLSGVSEESEDEDFRAEGNNETAPGALHSKSPAYGKGCQG